MVAHVIDHAADRRARPNPTPSFHGGPFPRAEAAVHGADVGCHKQRAIGITMRQARDGRIFVLVERVFLSPGSTQFPGGRDRLESDRVERVQPIDQRKVVRGIASLY